MDIIEKARAQFAANEAYEAAFRAHMHTFKPLDTETFWVVLDSLKDNLVSGLKAGRKVESEVHNLMCTFVHGSYRVAPIKDWPEDKMGRWENMVRFLRCYELVSHNLSIKMDRMPGLERGDDGYGDLMDSLPLAGREIVRAITEDEIANYKQLEKALVEHPLKKFVLGGENYVRMALEEKLKEQFPSIVKCMELEGEDRESPETVAPHVVLMVRPAKPENAWGDTQEITIAVRGPYKNGHEAAKYAEQEGCGIPVRVYAGAVLR
jgi:hypothetical protein